ncbi:aconitate hydratase AcnA [Candidatus Synchoanobacter obligatus]|uniref:Aconitate hydratase n=1 Tax=Candidatus Synchoanobacter obligatus TaxID=2919597 RepID=A0ABT1L580_9GAMM|nr:aconitate hydratase AcnA [Candidatus Synchoanobacter obligatus]
MDQGSTLTYQGKSYHIVDSTSIPYWRQLPYCLRILLENVLRNDPHNHQKWVETFQQWLEGQHPETAFYPARVLMQDLTGVPALVDLTAMRDAMKDLGGDPAAINPRCQVDLVIDHSVTVDFAKDAASFEKNVALEVQKNTERYELLKWAQGAFENVRIVPPGKGICHQVNLEYLASLVMEKDGYLFPDTLVGLDSHTTMINGLGILGWGVGGIEAEAAMLGQPVSLKLPKVIGVYLSGRLKPGVTATDLVLHMTQYLRTHGVVGQFVEFVGPGASALSLAERATVANMAPEFGATCAFFPADDATLDYLALTGRDQALIARSRAYSEKMSLMWDKDEVIEYSELIEFHLHDVEPCIAGPKRPEQRLPLVDVKPSLATLAYDKNRLSDASVVIAAITSCTNTSNPSVLIAAGLLAQNAVAKGLAVPEWVKTSFAPGSRVVIDYLKQLGLMEDLEALGFYLVGFGCTTCIGNSGPLDPKVAEYIEKHDLKVGAVLSGNRNFEGRVHPQTQYNYLASPPLVVAYALAGTVAIDFDQEPLGEYEGRPVYLKDIWPDDAAIQSAVKTVTSQMFAKEYQGIFEGTVDWERIQTKAGTQFHWQDVSTYIRQPNFFQGISAQPGQLEDIVDARVLAVFGDSVTTDHISPAGMIAPESAAAEYLYQKGVAKDGLHSYGARRGNADVMVRGTFANIRIKNLVSDREGGFSRHYPSGEVGYIYDVAMNYIADSCPTVVFAGKFYGTGSSRDWAAKGTKLLGVKAVIAESFERIHRSNLIGMGVLPCVLIDHQVAKLGLKGDELVSIAGIGDIEKPKQELVLKIVSDHEERLLPIRVEIDTANELQYFKHGGILSYMLRSFIGK